ncbi:hypothetical protein AKUH4B101A_01040 [Apilactobacillus kunkeei]|nr:hypothetical protein AKUH4B403J_01040 [Apilactobacillus kunkeei]CAI2554067.1 hypothetical protein AKUH4B103J_01040 [Apilactobacillus kunkeei]CAI2554081.1 hypothetical protein AKUH4B303J_01040 [Apilactobacillus kunkeei]CAI2554418.1 hypothetical protein AKUH4B116J_01040 [Apilactobacillus kunkeei]CAI2554521.1 hypothetical protein AKUH4B203M_01040 [Apilactobacillus kunkeei]
MKRKKTRKNSVKSWIIWISVIILGSAILGIIYDLTSNAFISENWHDFLKLTIVSAVGGLLWFGLYLIYSFIAEKIHKKHPTWFAPQDPPSKK